MSVDRRSLPEERKKKVLLVVRWPVGGIRTFLRYVYRGFAPAEWHFSIIAPDLREMRVLLEEDLAHLDVHFLPQAPRVASVQLAWSVARTLARGL